MLSRKSAGGRNRSLIVSSPSGTVSTAIRASSAICATVLILAATTVLLSAQVPSVGVCPVPQLNPPSVSYTLNVPRYNTYRPLVNGDYVVIEYNASQKKPYPQASDPLAGQTSWTDYSRHFDHRQLNNTTNIIGANGSFMPVIYTKEKVAVRVCGLHFTDVLTVTTSPNGVPEGAADIRGAMGATTVTPPASLSSTLDMLQSGVATGGTTNLPGLGLNAAASVPSLAVSGINPGNLGAETPATPAIRGIPATSGTPGVAPTPEKPATPPSYTPATVTASGRQVALLLYSVAINAKELTRLIGRTEGDPYPAEEVRTEEPGQREKAAPGSVKGLAFLVNRVLQNVEMDNKDPGTSDGLDRSNSAAFDKDMTDTQNANAQISSLASAITSQAFASNTITLLNNYSALVGVLDLANLARQPDYCHENPPATYPGQLSPDDLNKINESNLGNLSLSQIKGLDQKQIDQIPDKNLRSKIQSIQAALRLLTDKEDPGDEPVCSKFEKQKIADFRNSYNQELASIIHGIASDANKPYGDNIKNLGNENLECNAAGLTVNLEDPYPPDTAQEPNDEFERFAGCRLTELNEKLNELRGYLRKIDEETTHLYNLMNEWYFRSSVEQTDLLPPLVSNAFVRISIVVQRGYMPFTLANASGTYAPTATTNAPATSTTASTSTPAHAVKTILVEVHRVANFNLMGGVMVMRIPTASYAVQAAPTVAVQSTTTPPTYSGTCGGIKGVPVPPPTTLLNPGQSLNYGCIVRTQKSDWQVAGMAGITWFPWGHDYFPRHSGYANFSRNLRPSLLFATSVTSLGNSTIAVNWEPVSGLDFFAGIGAAHRTSLPSGFTVNTAVASGTTLSTVTTEHVGLTLGLGFDLNTIITLFTSKTTSVASMP